MFCRKSQATKRPTGGSLNPLSFGASVLSGPDKRVAGLERLNPLSFGASVLSEAAVAAAEATKS